MTKRERGEHGTIELQEKKNKMLWTQKKNAKQRKMKCMQKDLNGSKGVKTSVERIERRQMQVSRRYRGTNQRHKNRISIDRPRCREAIEDTDPISIDPPGIEVQARLR